MASDHYYKAVMHENRLTGVPTSTMLIDCLYPPKGRTLVHADRRS